MINLPNDYTTASTVGSGFPALEPGGYVCKITKTEVQITSKGSQMLAVMFDIAEGPQSNYFRNRYNHDKQTFKDEAKYKGIYRLFIENTDGSTNRFFKSFTTAVEESNQGYKFTGDENTLIGKLFGCIFRNREYLKPDGNMTLICDPFVSVSAETIRSGKFTVPETKKLDSGNTYSAPKTKYTSVGSNTDEDDIPF